jgi:hypothetical protein
MHGQAKLASGHNHGHADIWPMLNCRVLPRGGHHVSISFHACACGQPLFVALAV